MKEADLKSCIWDYLQIGINQRRWYADRLNSGSVVIVQGNSRRRVQLCREGTADFIVLKREYEYIDCLRLSKPEFYGDYTCKVIFLELKGDKGRWSPEQRAFKKLVEAQGASYFIVKSLEELQEILK